jgi:heme exporter protein B
MTAMSLISLLLFQLLLGNPLQHPLRFVGVVCLGGSSLSLVFTFLAAIAARAQQTAALMAIMGFPLIIPQLMLLMKISTSSFADVIQAGEIRLILVLVALDLLVVVLSVILFPFLWKE